jgi:radical SAM-linked protein
MWPLPWSSVHGESGQQVPDPIRASSGSPRYGLTESTARMLGDKFRFRFRKTGTLRLLSHLDLSRCLERMLRRAAVPFKSTAGFHPAPRMVFALSLPLGADGLDEVLEVEVTTPLDSDDVLARLNQQAPQGLQFTSVRVVPMKATAVPRRMTYTLAVPTARLLAAKQVALQLLEQEKLWVDRYKPRPRRLNIRPYIRSIAFLPTNPNTETEPGERIVIDLWVTQSGTARADELLKQLDLFDLLDAGSVLARGELEIRDETPPGLADAPPDGPPETAPLDHALAGAGDDAPAEPEWGLSPNGPSVE